MFYFHSLCILFLHLSMLFFAPLPPDGSYLLHQTGPKLFFDPHKHPEMWNIGQGEDWEIKGRIYLEQNKIFRWHLVLVFMIVIRKEMLNNDMQTWNLWKNCLTYYILKNYAGRKKFRDWHQIPSLRWDDNRDGQYIYLSKKVKSWQLKKSLIDYLT